MRKICNTVLLLTALLTVMSACEKDMMEYEGENSIYFDVCRGVEWVDSSRWPRNYFTGVNFINEPHDTVILYLKVAVGGEIKDYARPFTVEFVQDSSTAVEGVDFNFRRDWEIPAGAPWTHIGIEVYNHDYLLDTNRIVVLKVTPNEHFTTRLNFSKELLGRDPLGEELKKYNPDPRFHTVEMKVEVARPDSWMGLDYPVTPTNPVPTERGALGAFTPQKYLLMLKVLGMTAAEFEKGVPSSHVIAMGETFAGYLEEQFDAGTPVLEKDGRLMWVNAVRKWRPYQYEW